VVPVGKRIRGAAWRDRVVFVISFRHWDIWLLVLKMAIGILLRANGEIIHWVRYLVQYLPRVDYL
jgi:hypothetical protein